MSGTIQVQSTAGDIYLGGQDFDNVMLLLLKSKTSKCDHSQGGWPELAERVKKMLTTQKRVDVDLSSVLCNQKLIITEEEFAQVSQTLLDRAVIPVYKSIEKLSLPFSSISDVVLVGGGSRMPLIRQSLTHVLENEGAVGVRIHDNLNPDEVVAIGAANLLD